MIPLRKLQENYTDELATNDELREELKRIEMMNDRLREENTELMRILGPKDFMDVLKAVYFKSPIMHVAYRRKIPMIDILPCPNFLRNNRCYKLRPPYNPKANEKRVNSLYLTTAYQLQ